MGALVPSASLSDSNIDSVLNHSTIEQYQRKIAWILPAVDYESTDASALITFCGFNLPCLPLGIWSLDMDRTQMGMLNASLYRHLEFSRFDTIDSNSKQLSLTTETDRFSTPIDRPLVAPAKKQSYSQHKQALETQLEEVVMPFTELMVQSLNARAKEQLDKESGTAATIELKTAGLNKETIQQLMDSGFVFKAYLERPDAHINVTQVRQKRENVMTLRFATTVSVSVDIKLTAFKLNPNTQQFNHYKTWNGSSGLFTQSQSFDVMPTPKRVQQTFDAAFENSVDSAFSALSLKMREDSSFLLKSKVLITDGSHLETDLHEGLDFRVGSQWFISRFVDDQSQQIGLAKATQVAPIPTHNSQLNSYLIRIKGDAEVGDQITENPWTGSQHGLSFEQFNLTLTQLSGYRVFPSDNSVSALRYTRHFDRGYHNDDPDLVEHWSTFSLAFGVLDQSISFVENPSYEFSSPVYFDFRGRYGKHYDLGATGLGLEPFIGGGLHYVSASSTDVNGGDDIQLSIMDLSATIGTAFQWTFGHFSKLNFTIEYPLQLIADSGLQQGEKELAGFGSAENNFDYGIRYSLGVQWNTN